jgi:hypothetical protein
VPNLLTLPAWADEFIHVVVETPPRAKLTYAKAFLAE